MDAQRFANGALCVQQNAAANRRCFSASRDAGRLLARRLLLLSAVNEDCGSPDCFGHCWLKLRDKLEAPHPRKLGAVVAMPFGSQSLFPIGRGRATRGSLMSYLVPSEFVTKMVDAGESKIFMSTRDTVIRAYMAGAILALAAWFAVTINVNTGQPIIGALLFPVGFSMLYLLGFDLLTGVFVLSPLAWLDKRPGVTFGGVLRNWGLVFIGNFAGALTVAFMMAFVTTFGFTQDPDKVGAAIGNIGESRTLGYAAHGAAGMATLFIRGMLCNWMVSTGVVGAMVSTTVPGKVIAMWMPILVFFYMVFEHSVVNMFLFPSGLMLHAKFSILDYFIWNEIPTVLGNLVGGLAFTGLTLYATHVRTAPARQAVTTRAAA
jgi:formate transporter